MVARSLEDRVETLARTYGTPVVTRKPAQGHTHIFLPYINPFTPSCFSPPPSHSSRKLVGLAICYIQFSLLNLRSIEGPPVVNAGGVAPFRSTFLAAYYVETVVLTYVCIAIVLML